MKSRTTDDEQTVQIGRGALYLTLTKLYFIVGSYAIYFGIPRLAGESGDATFADYKLIGALLSVIGTVLVMGTTQAVSRFVGRSPQDARGIASRAFRLQLALGAIVSATYFVVAPMRRDDPDLVNAIRISAFIPLAYALYSVSMGSLNGQRRFAEQALVDALFTSLKVVGVLLGVALFHDAAGGYAGFSAAAVLACLGATALARRSHRPLQAEIGHEPRPRTLLLFQLQTVGFMLLVQWVVQMDLWYVNWWGTDDATVSLAAESARGSGEELALTRRKAAAALYGGAQLFSQIAYSLVVSVTFVLFPLVSGMGDDRPAARGYVREALRYAMLMVVGVAVCLSAVPEATLGLLLRDISLNLAIVPGGAEALRWLALGYVFFALLFVLCAVLNAAGRPRRSMAIMGLTLVIQGVLGAILVPSHGITGQAIAGLIAMATGFFAGSIDLGRWLGNVIPVSTAVRVGVAGASAYATAVLWHPEGTVMTLVRIALCGTLYLGMTIVMGEFGAQDLARFRGVLSGRGRSGT